MPLLTGGLVIGGLVVGGITYACSCVNAWSERKAQEEEDVRESLKASEKAAQETAKEERQLAAKLSAEQRMLKEKHAAEVRAVAREEAREKQKRRTVEDRMARWKKRMKKTFAVNTGRRAFVGKVIAIDEESVTFQDGAKAEKAVKYADLEACPVKPAALKDSAAWIFPVQSKAPEAGSGGADLDDMHP
jgi:hypothetical protein